MTDDPQETLDFPGLCRWVGWKGKVSMGIAGLGEEEDPTEGGQIRGEKC